MLRFERQQRQRQARRRTSARAGILIALLCTPVMARAAAPPPALFTESEAAQGRIVFEQNCAACHGEDLRGKVGPALIGPSFGSAGAHTTVSITFNVIAFEMPLGNPASLTKQTYAEIMAYILQRNGYPAGAHALSYADAQASNTPLISQLR